MYDFPAISQRGISKTSLTDYWVRYMTYTTARVNCSIKLGSARLRIDAQLQGLSQTGKLFKLKSLRAQIHPKTSFWGINESIQYIDKLLEDFTRYSKLQASLTSTIPITTRFKIVPIIYKPYSSRYYQWSLLEEPQHEYGLPVITHHPITTPGFKYYG